MAFGLWVQAETPSKVANTMSNNGNNNGKGNGNDKPPPPGQEKKLAKIQQEIKQQTQESARQEAQRTALADEFREQNRLDAVVEDIVVGEEIVNEPPFPPEENIPNPKRQEPPAELEETPPAEDLSTEVDDDTIQDLPPLSLVVPKIPPTPGFIPVSIEQETVIPATSPQAATTVTLNTGKEKESEGDTTYSRAVGGGSDSQPTDTRMIIGVVAALFISFGVLAAVILFIRRTKRAYTLSGRDPESVVPELMRKVTGRGRGRKQTEVSIAPQMEKFVIGKPYSVHVPLNHDPSMSLERRNQKLAPVPSIMITQVETPVIESPSTSLVLQNPSVNSLKQVKGPRALPLSRNQKSIPKASPLRNLVRMSTSSSVKHSKLDVETPANPGALRELPILPPKLNNQSQGHQDNARNQRSTLIQKTR
jgi:hypothetical protein